MGQIQRTNQSQLQRDTTQRTRILGDTIKAKYNALTTKFTYQKYIKENDLQFFHPDTIPDNFHHFTDQDRNQNYIQNLGNLGTPINRLLFEPRQEIGLTSGYHGFDDFYTGPDKIRYFDTRSPYSDVTANFGGGGRARNSIVFAVNDSTHLSFGFSYRNIRADKVLAFTQRGDRNVVNSDWNLFAYIKPKKHPNYQALFNITQMKHEIEESGGIIPPEIDPDTNPNNPDSTLFAYQDANVILTDAIGLEKRGGVHIYQQLALDSAFQLYHEGDYYEQLIRYNDSYDLGTIDSLIYSDTGSTTADVANRTTFKEIKNEVGIKGRTSKFAYSAYYKIRNLSRQNVSLPNTQKNTEHFVGGTLRQQISNKIFLKARGEFLLDGQYVISGNFSSDLFEATVTRTESKPTYLVSQYTGQQFSWENSFANEASDHIVGLLKLGVRSLDIKPSLRLSRLTNYIYFDTARLPQQAGSDIVLITPGIDLDWSITQRWTWKNSVRYSNLNGGSSNLYRIPEVMGNSQISWKNTLFDGRMIFQTGIDVHYRTAYSPLDYNPITQQYFLQDDFEADSFIKADLFLNFKVENFHLFLKFAHANQSLGRNGYFLSPYYTGPRNTLDLGMRWSFFD